MKSVFYNLRSDISQLLLKTDLSTSTDRVNYESKVLHNTEVTFFKRSTVPYTPLILIKSLKNVITLFIRHILANLVQKLVDY